jgi:hypothetical protein
MKKNYFVPTFVFLIVVFFASAVFADDDTLVKFKGGIGVHAVSNVAGAANPDGTFPNVTRNVVHGVNPAGQIWVIRDLEAEVKTNGDIEVKGKGLILGGGNNVGTSGTGQQVRARLFCGGVAHDSGLVPLALNGDFNIDDVLSPFPPPNPCNNPVLLIVSAGGNWFAAGILDFDDD